MRSFAMPTLVPEYSWHEFCYYWNSTMSPCRLEEQMPEAGRGGKADGRLTDHIPPGAGAKAIRHNVEYLRGRAG